MLRQSGVYARCLLVGCILYAASDSEPAFSAVAPSWSDISADKRCEGMLEFFKGSVPKDLPEWSLKKPKCVISGSAAGDGQLAFDLSFQKAKQLIPIRFIVSEQKGRKPSLLWCLVKGEVEGCASPWESSFAKGPLFPKEDEARSAYSNVLKAAQGLLSLVTNLDAWIGKQAKSDLIFGVDYNEWVKQWVKSAKKLPTKDGEVLADFNPERENVKTGTVTFEGKIPQSLRECLGCGKTACEKSLAAYEFSGIGLSLTRRLTPEEQKVYETKMARASWIMVGEAPVVGGQIKWPFLCGEHRFSIQKI